MNSLRLSIIIPTLQEEDNLARLLKQIRRQKGIEVEILVADGGSRDGTEGVARAFGARWIVAVAGRGRQMNQAAKVAGGEELLFLHADSGLPAVANFLAIAVAALVEARVRLGSEAVAGHFPLRFATTRKRLGRQLRFHEWKSRLNRPFCANGDQGLLLSRAFFRQLGGFDESLPFLEDLRLGEKIRHSGHWVTLPGELVTSARRFEVEGYEVRTLLNLLVVVGATTGLQASLSELPEIYRPHSESPEIFRPHSESPGTCRSPVGGSRPREEGEPRTRIARCLKWLAATVGRLPPGERIRWWYRLGIMARSHGLWQVFLWLDLRVGRTRLGTRRPFLAFHDRLLAPLTRLGIFDAMAAILLYLAFLGSRSCQGRRLSERLSHGP
ncbi:MAG: TIGR04283 family arsenosugar biosynthesis glycosyltransferase [Magnetococcales bacterium]|nr:TIGR04283 family arsenosugar biosynthesis glycosyltransferase [Magnetococcales bacterium]